MTVLLTKTNNGITTVTMNRPKQMNALSIELRNALDVEFSRLRDDPETDVIILTGAGEKAFSAGLDLKELGQTGLPSEATESHDLHDAIREVGKPVIGAINGFAVTGGFEIALMCDILVASEHAKFADTHVRMGVVPGWGLSQRLSKLVGSSRARELSFSARYLDAETAASWGLVNRVLPAEELMPFCTALAEDIQQADKDTLKAVQALISYSQNHGLDQGLTEEDRVSHEHGLKVSKAALENRREQVMESGRKQN